VTNEPAGPTRILVLHAWVEPGRRLRVRATGSTPGQPDRPTTTYAATEAEVLRIVAGWLAELTVAPDR
jgi:hypothetical protein